MSNADNLNEPYSLMKMDKSVPGSVKKPKVSEQEERLAEVYERQRRERKEKLYSFRLESH
jgi:hypothetical protein